MAALGSKSWYVIINPTSGNGSSIKKWPQVKQLLDTYKFNFEFVFTEYHSHGAILAQLAIDKGFTNIISVGGDGTLHNIVNGIMSQNYLPAYNINVGVIPIGTGNDWVKTHKIPKNIESAIKVIKKGVLKQQDVGKIVLEDSNKKTVYFINLAGVGFDGYVVSKVEKYKRFGAMAYLIGTLMGLYSFKNFLSKTIVNSTEVTDKTLMVLVGLCNYSGGGMQLTKKPDAFDGFLDISIAKNFSKIDIIKNATKLFNGKIVNLQKVKCYKASAISVVVKDKALPFIQADGELIGNGGFSAVIIPKSFSFYSG